MKRPSIVIIYSLLVFLAAACSYKKIEFDTQSGKNNTVKVGDKFRITLLENHIKNDYWLLKENSDKRSVDYLGSVFHGNKSGEVDFNFEALQSGEITLTFNLNHFNDSTDTKIFKVNVVNQ